MNKVYCCNQYDHFFLSQILFKGYILELIICHVPLSANNDIESKFFEGKKKGEISDADAFLVAQKFENKARKEANLIWNQGYSQEQGYTKEDLLKIEDECYYLAFNDCIEKNR